MNNQNEKLFGFYSAKHDKLLGHVIYSTEGGTEVMVTCVDRNEQCDNYKWDDKIPVGEVKEFIRGMWKKEKHSFY